MQLSGSAQVNSSRRRNTVGVVRLVRGAGRGRARYVPEVLAVRRWVARGEALAAAVEQISAINVELLARRELR